MNVKIPVLAACAVATIASIAESQTANLAPAPQPAAADAASAPVAVTDEVALEENAGGGTVELSLSGRARGEQLVNIVCEDATLSEILRQFRRTVRANIVSGSSTNLERRVSIALHDAPWMDAIQSVLSLGGFTLEDRNGIYFVAEEKDADPIRSKSYTLNHADADELAKLINDSFGEKDKNGKSLGGVATVFKDSNVVVVKGTDKTIRECDAIVKAVDCAPAQVYIEARFIELSNEAMHNLGIKWDTLKEYGVSVRNLKAGFENNGGHAADYGTRLTQRSQNLTSGSNSTIGDNTTANSTISEDAAGARTTSTSDGVTGNNTTTRNSNNSDNSTFSSLVPTAIGEAAGAGASAASMGWKNAYTFSGQISADNFNLALSAFEQMNDVKIFSNPRIIVSNGKEAKVDMTTKYPNVTVQASRSSGLSEALDISTRIEVIPGEDKHMFAKEAFFSWGISLSVTPRISPDGLINVEVVPTISDRSDWAAVEGNGAEGSVYSKYPVISIQRLVTDFTMKDGSTAVIGGLTRTTEEDVDSGIPYLRQIPWVGPKLFGWKGRSKIQKEIIVFVTVGIANPSALETDIGLPKNAVLSREYVEGRAFEPGDRGGVKQSMELDMTPLDKRRDGEAETTSPAAEPKAAAPAQAAQPATPAAASVAPAAAPEPASAVAPVQSAAAPKIEIAKPEPKVVRVRPEAPKAEQVGTGPVKGGVPASAAAPANSTPAGPSKTFVPSAPAETPQAAATSASNDETVANAGRRIRHGRVR